MDAVQDSGTLPSPVATVEPLQRADIWLQGSMYGKKLIIDRYIAIGL